MATTVRSVSTALSRRNFLYGVAGAAGATLLAACSSAGDGGRGGGPAAQPTGSPTTATTPKAGSKAGSATTPLPKPTSFQDSPALAAAGLPPVAERLPENPYVVPHRWLTRGKYGGTLNMNVFGTTGMADASSTREFFYGHSPTRWLNDGLDIGPGVADKWSSNADATQWTIHFRKGLKWSDGHPFTVDDVLFWYEDIVLPGHDGQTVPIDCLSAKAHPCRMRRIDDQTLRITYDAPQPLVPDYLAAWVKGGVGSNGPSWVLPKHYLTQFHPKYNNKVPHDWDATGGLWEQKADWLRNPECPTLIGYRCKSFNNNQGVVLERNPYYYAVTREGDQLPYIDRINVNLVQNAETLKLEVQQGKIDFLDGAFNQVDLSDVSTLSQNKDKGGYEILLWDSGAGAASIFYFNYDYIAKDEKYGKLFRDKRFIRSISYAYDRQAIRKTVYFGTGEVTTGTMSPKAIEFHVNATGNNLYSTWRDSYKKRDLSSARRLLRELGLKDTNGDGYVEFPDGSKLTIDLGYSADISNSDAAKQDQLVSDLKDVGIRLVRRPISPQSYGSQWSSGQLMASAVGEAGDGPNLLIYPGWVVPFNSGNTWAPLETAWNSLTGTPKQTQENGLPALKRHPPRLEPAAGGPIEKMWELYNQARLRPDAMDRHELVWKILKVHIEDGPFFIGAVADYPRVMVSKTDLQNVPARDQLAQHGFVNPWVVPCPAVYDPETFYWTNPAQHGA